MGLMDRALPTQSGGRTACHVYSDLGYCSDPIDGCNRGDPVATGQKTIRLVRTGDRGCGQTLCTVGFHRRSGGLRRGLLVLFVRYYRVCA